MKLESLYQLANTIIKCPVTNTRKLKETLTDYIKELKELLEPPFFVQPTIDHDFKMIQIIIENRNSHVARLMFNDSEHMVLQPDDDKSVIYKLFCDKDLLELEKIGIDTIRENNYSIVKHNNNTIINGIDSIHDYLLKWKVVYNTGLIDTLNNVYLVLGLYQELRKNDETQEKMMKHKKKLSKKVFNKINPN